MPSIFISHCRADKEFARLLANRLEAEGDIVWLDEAEIGIGNSLISKIKEGIDRMDYVGVVLTPESASSEWVKREVEIALTQEIEGKRVNVLPLMHKHCELPGFLLGKLYADFTQAESFDRQFE